MSDERQMSCQCTTETPCCAGVRVDPIDVEQSRDLAVGLKALGDPHRIAVIHLLTGADGPVCVVDIERHLPLSQSTVSYHLKALLDAGVIDRERRGRWSYYSVRSERLDELSHAVGEYARRVAQPA